MANDASGVLWRRLKYLLSPQLDLYKRLNKYTTDERVIEIGFGTGYQIMQYVEKAAHVDAYELDKHAVDHASEMIKHDKILFHVGDIASPTFYAPSIYGVALLIEVLEHVPQQQEALQNVVKCLRPDGIAIISGPNANAELRKNDIHEREWTAQEFYSELGHHFTSVKLFDYTLTEEQDESSRLTPLIAVCQNDIKNI